MNTVSIRPLTTADVPEALAVLNEALGNGFVDEDDLSRYAGGADRRALVAELPTGEIAGALTFDIRDAIAHVPADQRETVSRLIPQLSAHTGLLRSGAVSAPGRGMGIGSALIGTAAAELEAARADGILGVAWTDHEGCHVQGVLERLGFQFRGDVNGFWTRDSIELRYQCATCGHPCRCSARLFWRRLSDVVVC